MASTTEDAVILSQPEAVVPTYDPANASAVLDTTASGYDQLVINSTQTCVVVPPRGY